MKKAYDAGDHRFNCLLEYLQRCGSIFDLISGSGSKTKAISGSGTRTGNKPLGSTNLVVFRSVPGRVAATKEEAEDYGLLCGKEVNRDVAVNTHHINSASFLRLLRVEACSHFNNRVGALIIVAGH